MFPNTTKISQAQLMSDDVPSIHGLRRLHSYPSGSDTDQELISPPRPTGKPPVPERNSEILSKYGRKLPPPPPPRSSSSRSPQSPTSPNLPARGEQPNSGRTNANNSYFAGGEQDSGSESNNSQDNNSQRQHQLEARHQELLKKQKTLQEQYQRLQQMSKNTIPLASNDDLKKTLSELSSIKNALMIENMERDDSTVSPNIITTNKVYETEIL